MLPVARVPGEPSFEKGLILPVFALSKVTLPEAEYPHQEQKPAKYNEPLHTCRIRTKFEIAFPPS